MRLWILIFMDFCTSRKADIYQINQNSEPVKVQKQRLGYSEISQIDFMLNQSERKILWFTHCALYSVFSILPSLILGYIGDRIGYRTVLIINLILAGISATSFDWTPRFTEYIRTPTIHFNATSDQNEVLKFVWPLDCNSENITATDCKNDPILSDEDFSLNLDQFVNCTNSMDGSDLELDMLPNFTCKFNKKRNCVSCAFEIAS